MCKIVSRIQEVAVAENVTIGAIERRIGASKGVLSRAINNGTDIQSKWLESLVENYPHISPVWLLTGMGDMYISDNNLPSTSEQTDVPTGILQNFITTIQEQAEEIGRLRERISQLEREKGKDASGARTSGVANVG